jgi:hypothetical protein
MKSIVMILSLLLFACSFTYARAASVVGDKKNESSTGAADASVSPGSLDFGDQAVGSSSRAQRITLTNTGSDKLYVNSANLGGDDWQQFRVALDSCTGSTILPQKSCVIDIVFAPGKKGGQKTVLTLIDNAPDTPQKVDVTGNGINSADVPPASQDL